MFRLSPSFMLSPRFLALPLIALAVLVALSQTTPRASSTGQEASAPKIFRAVNCSDPAKAGSAGCTVAGNPTVTVR